MNRHVVRVYDVEAYDVDEDGNFVDQVAGRFITQEMADRWLRSKVHTAGRFHGGGETMLADCPDGHDITSRFVEFDDVDGTVYVDAGGARDNCGEWA